MLVQHYYYAIKMWLFGGETSMIWLQLAKERMPVAWLALPENHNVFQQREEDENDAGAHPDVQSWHVADFWGVLPKETQE